MLIVNTLVNFFLNQKICNFLFSNLTFLLDCCLQFLRPCRWFRRCLLRAIKHKSKTKNIPTNFVCLCVLFDPFLSIIHTIRRILWLIQQLKGNLIVKNIDFSESCSLTFQKCFCKTLGYNSQYFRSYWLLKGTWLLISLIDFKGVFLETTFSYPVGMIKKKVLDEPT